MKKLIVSIVIIGVFTIYCFMHAHAAPVALTPKTTSADAPTATPSGTVATGTPPASDATATSTPASRYKDGSYTGSVADAQWGYIQVKAIIKNGKITDVQFLQYPNERERSVYINSIADPELTSEAIQAQSAQVDYISGATDTSEAFMQSLSDALAQAQA
jgi:uncharacterized protein with FMN-binding domain